MIGPKKNQLNRSQDNLWSERGDIIFIRHMIIILLSNFDENSAMRQGGEAIYRIDKTWHEHDLWPKYFTYLWRPSPQDIVTNSQTTSLNTALDITFLCISFMQLCGQPASQTDRCPTQASLVWATNKTEGNSPFNILINNIQHLSHQPTQFLQ